MNRKKPISKEEREESDKNRLEAVLTEYDNLRTEIREMFKLHLQLYTIALSAIALSLGYAFVNRVYDLLLIMPAFCIALLYRWLWDQNSILALSYYLTLVENRKIPLLLGYVNNSNKESYKGHWMAWQLFYLDHMAHHLIPRTHMLSIVILFGFPFALSVGYTVFYVLSNLPCLNLKLPSLLVYVIANSVYTILLTHIIFIYKKLTAYFAERYRKELGIELVL